MDMQINVPTSELAAYCKRNQIRRLSLFGSVLGERFGPNSDIDVLVEFEPDVVVGLLAMARMQRELSELFGRAVDLRTPNDLSRYFRSEVLANARVQYERAG